MVLPMRPQLFASILLLMPAAAALAQQDPQQERAAQDLALSSYITATETLSFLQQQQPLAQGVSPACQQGVNSLLARMGFEGGVSVKYLSERPLNPANKLSDTDAPRIREIASRSSGDIGAGDWKVDGDPASGYAHVLPLRMTQTCVQCHGMAEHIKNNVRLLTSILRQPPQAPNFMPGDTAGYLVIDIPQQAVSRHAVVDNTLVLPVPSKDYNIYLSATQEAMVAPPAKTADAWQNVYKKLPTASQPFKETLFIRQALALALEGYDRDAADAMTKAKRIGTQPGHWYTMPRLQHAQPVLPINSCKKCHDAGDLKNMVPVKLIAQGR
ncbi:MAG: DUF3365 domain-containing protein [Proteobacteria bacterium]|nr:DUF3365 domain-containing protein [Pseudomonadota bacterium]